jgi:hypothetical protein
MANAFVMGDSSFVKWRLVRVKPSGMAFVGVMVEGTNVLQKDARRSQHSEEIVGLMAVEIVVELMDVNVDRINNMNIYVRAIIVFIS